jgi:hypothetical protein
MSTPKEKANELVKLHKQLLLRGQFQISGFYIDQIAEECALIAVDEIISVIDPETNYKTWEFYKQVKQEIEKL